MKIRYTIIGLALAGIVFTGCHIDKAHKHGNEEADEEVASTEVQEEEIIGNYGAEITTDGAIPANQVLAELGENESTRLKVEGVIREVCQTKGCWMTMDVGNGQTMRITFKDYGFFVPKPSAGYRAVIEGKLSKQLVDVETLQHYAEDEGKSEEEIMAITEPEERLSFEAVGVVITGAAG